MFEILLKLIILFAVIIDPLLSLVFFTTATEKMKKAEKLHTATKSMILAIGISILILFFGEYILKLFSLELNHLRIAGGIILGLLGVNMTLGLTFKHAEEQEDNSADAISTIIATPLISGPACITTIIVSAHDYGRLITGSALGLVLLLTAGMLYFACLFDVKKIGTTGIKISTTMMGLVTLAWGVSFILTGLGL
jgi:multiple antibiotic resistance protein